MSTKPAVKPTYIVLAKGSRVPFRISTLCGEWKSTACQDGLILKGTIYDEYVEQMIDSELTAAGFQRLFERCYFQNPLVTHDFSGLVSGFFSTISDEYDALINADWNCECYNYLFSLANYSANSARHKILDFGCGDGTIMGTNLSESAEIIGFDASIVMSGVASSRGLTVLTHKEYCNLPPFSFDLILSAYVLHYHIPESDLFHLLGRLKNGGMLVGNFHKGYEKSLMIESSELLKQRGFTTEWTNSKFGPCVVVKNVN